MWTAMIPTEAKKWRKERIDSLFPSIFNMVTNPTTPTTPNNESLILQLIAQMQQSAQTPLTVTPASLTNSTNTVPTKTSVFKKRLLKRLCGHMPQVDESVLPVWSNTLFQAHQDNKDKDHIVAKLLSSPGRFEDVDIPIYPELKKWSSNKTGLEVIRAEILNLPTHATEYLCLQCLT